MHIIISVITAIAALLWALNSLQRSGFDLNALNPFLWARRKEWERKRNTRPIYSLEHPIEIAAVLVVAVASEGGALLRSDRERVAGILVKDLKLTEDYAREMLTLSEHMLRDGPSINNEVPKILAPAKGKFTAAQVESLAAILRAVPTSRPPTPGQLQIITSFEACFAQPQQNNGEWRRD